jgi:hypothetical protein
VKAKDSDKWLKAMKEQMTSRKSQGAWVLTELSQEKKVLVDGFLKYRKLPKA